MGKMLGRMTLGMLLLCCVMHLLATPAAAQQCRRDGNANQDAGVTPADAVLALQAFLHPAAQPLDPCWEGAPGGRSIRMKRLA